ncbi:MAG TPA: hypothetical protein VM261_27945 [Kofleriaceae bacterium]|nr:hypothetical protein [Kofleriaceae bacterium]
MRRLALALVLCASCSTDDIDVDLGSEEQSLIGTYQFIPAPPSQNAAPTLKVSGLSPFTSVTLYKSQQCLGVAYASKSTGLTNNVSFTSLTVNLNNRTYWSVKVGATCDATVLVYVHDTIAPQPPRFTSLTPAAPNAILDGLTEGNAKVQLYRDAGCTSPYLSTITATATGTFTVTLPQALSAPLIYGKATDAALNTSACSSQWTAWSPSHAEECPALAADVPVSRPPVYAYLEFADRFFPWADECHEDRASCPSGGPTDTYFDYLEKMKPALVQTQGGSPAALPMFWGYGPLGEKATRSPNYECNVLYDTSPTGTPHAVFGAGNWQGHCGLTHYFQDAPFATPAQIQQRMDALAEYVDEFGPSRTEWAPYTDLDTQLMGDYENRTGFWSFWDNEYDDFVAAGLLAPKTGDPTHWLLRQPTLNTDADHPAWSDLSFMYGPTKPAYDPYHRFAVDPIHPEFVSWLKQVYGLAGKAGLDRVMVDNAFGVRCWNDDCAAEFPVWAASTYANAASLLRRPPNSMVSDAGMETWARSTVPPFQWLQAAKWYYGSATGGTLAPTTDAYSGMYAGKFTANAAGSMLQFHTLASGLTPGTPAGCNDPTWYRIDFAYKSTMPVTVKLYHDYYDPFVEVTLPPAASWTKTSMADENFLFQMTPADHQVAMYISAGAAGTLTIDDVELRPTVSPTCVAPLTGPITAGALVLNGEGWADPARATMTNAYWESLVERTLSTMVTSARQGNPDFDILVNSSGVQFPSADWSMTEARGTSEQQRLMWDQGLQPGYYPSGHAFPDPWVQNGTVTLPADTIVANAFTARMIGANRLPTPFAQMLITRQAEAGVNAAHNADTVLLQMAEDAAFVGGAGTDPDLVAHYYYYPQALLDAATERVRTFFEWVRLNPDLYQCLRYSAQVGVVLRADSVMAPMTSATPHNIRLFEKIAASGVTVDVVGGAKITGEALSRLKVLVLDHAHRISETEAVVINAWVLAGGIVIATSDSGLRDELGRNRDAMPTTSWVLPAATAAPIANKIWVVPAADIEPQHILTALTPASGANPSAFPTLPAADTAALRLAVWTGWDRLVVHLLNYKVPRGLNNGGMVSTRFDLTVTIAIPKDAPTQVPTVAELRTPEGATTTRPVTVSNGRATFTVPTLRVYTIATLR